MDRFYATPCITGRTAGTKMWDETFHCKQKTRIHYQWPEKRRWNEFGETKMSLIGASIICVLSMQWSSRLDGHGYCELLTGGWLIDA